MRSNRTAMYFGLVLSGVIFVACTTSFAMSCTELFTELFKDEQSKNIYNHSPNVNEEWSRAVADLTKTIDDLRRRPEVKLSAKQQQSFRLKIQRIYQHYPVVRQYLVAYVERKLAREREIQELREGYLPEPDSGWKKQSYDPYANVKSLDSYIAMLKNLNSMVAAGKFHPRFLIAVHPSFKENFLQSVLTDNDLARQWSQATDAVQGADPEHSRFFVLAVDRVAEDKPPKDTIVGLANLGGIPVSDGFWTNHVEHPELLHQKAIHSVSYIGPGARSTFRNVGFILDVPQENIFKTYTVDSGSPVYADPPNISAELLGRKILGPDELLSNTNGYNELNIVGQHPASGRRIKVKGVFYAVDSQGRQKISKDELDWWTKYCVTKGFPPPVAIKQEATNNKMREIPFWYAAVSTAKNSVDKGTGDLRAWWPEFEQQLHRRGVVSFHSEMMKVGLQYDTAPPEMQKYLKVVQVGPNQYRLQLINDPPSTLRFPYDQALSFREK